MVVRKMKGHEMKASDYKKLKKEVLERYNKAVQKAENERVEALAAIEKVWKMTKPNYGKSSSSTSSSTSTDYGLLAKTVRESLELVPQTFTKKNILTAMQQISSDVANKCNSNSLSGCLHRLKNEGVIEVVKRGRGSSPSEYRKVDTTATEQEQNQEQI